jgi:hypothetical protein
MITTDTLRQFLGQERLARLEKMPVVAERGGLEQHLQAACKDTSTLSQALVKCLRSAGGCATREDLQRAAEMEAVGEDAETRREGDGEIEATAESAEGKRRKKATRQ